MIYHLSLQIFSTLLVQESQMHINMTCEHDILKIKMWNIKEYLGAIATWIVVEEKIKMGMWTYSWKERVFLW